MRHWTIVASVLAALTGAKFANAADAVSVEQVSGYTQAAMTIDDTMATAKQLIAASSAIMSKASSEGNSAYTLQFGSYNSAETMQAGARNVSFIAQDGYHNSAAVQQAGAGHQSMILQKGVGNTAVVSQH